MPEPRTTANRVIPASPNWQVAPLLRKVVDEEIRLGMVVMVVMVVVVVVMWVMVVVGLYRVETDD